MNSNSQRFHVKINIKLEAVTCPGVWLCSHGYLEVTIKVLGYFFRTGAIEPFFPLLCHDHFKMEGYFKYAHSISQVISSLSRETLKITLWQNSRRLAYYEGVLVDLLHYTEPKLQCSHTSTRQLLMKTTTAFPGIIAPKVEISSQFFINDEVLNLLNTFDYLNTVKNPVATDTKPTQYQRPCTALACVSENSTDPQQRIRKQKTVCHTRDLKNATQKLANDFVYSRSTGRRVSIASSSSSDNTHTSVGICDIEHDGQKERFDDYNHDHFCELCRLYKEMFLQ